MSLAGITSAIVLSMSPVLEVRGAIPIAVALGTSIWVAFILAFIANVALIPLVFLFLDYAHDHLMKVNLYSRMFNLYLSNVRKRSEAKIKGAWPYVALFCFVGIPLPGTGVWTAGLVSWFFEMDRKKSFFSMVFGSLCVSVITTLIVLGVVRIW